MNRDRPSPLHTIAVAANRNTHNQTYQQKPEVHAQQNQMLRANASQQREESMSSACAGVLSEAEMLNLTGQWGSRTGRETALSSKLAGTRLSNQGAGQPDSSILTLTSPSPDAANMMTINNSTLQKLLTTTQTNAISQARQNYQQQQPLGFNFGAHLPLKGSTLDQLTISGGENSAIGSTPGIEAKNEDIDGSRLYQEGNNHLSTLLWKALKNQPQNSKQAEEQLRQVGQVRLQLARSKVGAAQPQPPENRQSCQSVPKRRSTQKCVDLRVNSGSFIRRRSQNPASAAINRRKHRNGNKINLNEMVTILDVNTKPQNKQFQVRLFRTVNASSRLQSSQARSRSNVRNRELKLAWNAPVSGPIQSQTRFKRNSASPPNQARQEGRAPLVNRQNLHQQQVVQDFSTVPVPDQIHLGSLAADMKARKLRKFQQAYAEFQMWMDQGPPLNNLCSEAALLGNRQSRNPSKQFQTVGNHNHGRSAVSDLHLLKDSSGLGRPQRNVNRVRVQTATQENHRDNSRANQMHDGKKFLFQTNSDVQSLNVMNPDSQSRHSIIPPDKASRAYQLYKRLHSTQDEAEQHPKIEQEGNDDQSGRSGPSHTPTGQPAQQQKQQVQIDEQSSDLSKMFNNNVIGTLIFNYGPSQQQSQQQAVKQNEPPVLVRDQASEQEQLKDQPHQRTPIVKEALVKMQSNCTVSRSQQTEERSCVEQRISNPSHEESLGEQQQMNIQEQAASSQDVQLQDVEDDKPNESQRKKTQSDAALPVQEPLPKKTQEIKAQQMSSTELLASSSQYPTSGVMKSSSNDGLSSIETAQLIAFQKEDRAAESRFINGTFKAAQPFVPPLNLETITAAAPEPSNRQAESQQQEQHNVETTEVSITSSNKTPQLESSRPSEDIRASLARLKAKVSSNSVSLPSQDSVKKASAQTPDLPDKVSQKQSAKRSEEQKVQEAGGEEKLENAEASFKAVVVAEAEADKVPSNSSIEEVKIEESMRDSVHSVKVEAAKDDQILLCEKKESKTSVVSLTGRAKSSQRLIEAKQEPIEVSMHQILDENVSKDESSKTCGSIELRPTIQPVSRLEEQKQPVELPPQQVKKESKVSLGDCDCDSSLNSRQSSFTRSPEQLEELITRLLTQVDTKTIELFKQDEKNDNQQARKTIVKKLLSQATSEDKKKGAIEKSFTLSNIDAHQIEAPKVMNKKQTTEYIGHLKPSMDQDDLTIRLMQTLSQNSERKVCNKQLESISEHTDHNTDKVLGGSLRLKDQKSRSNSYNKRNRKSFYASKMSFNQTMKQARCSCGAGSMIGYEHGGNLHIDQASVSSFESSSSRGSSAISFSYKDANEAEFLDILNKASVTKTTKELERDSIDQTNMGNDEQAQSWENPQLMLTQMIRKKLQSKMLEIQKAKDVPVKIWREADTIKADQIFKDFSHQVQRRFSTNDFEMTLGTINQNQREQQQIYKIDLKGGFRMRKNRSETVKDGLLSDANRFAVPALCKDFLVIEEQQELDCNAKKKANIEAMRKKFQQNRRGMQTTDVVPQNNLQKLARSITLKEQRTLLRKEQEMLFQTQVGLVDMKEFKKFSLRNLLRFQTCETEMIERSSLPKKRRIISKYPILTGLDNHHNAGGFSGVKMDSTRDLSKYQDHHEENAFSTDMLSMNFRSTMLKAVQQQREDFYESLMVSPQKSWANFVLTQFFNLKVFNNLQQKIEFFPKLDSTVTYMELFEKKTEMLEEWGVHDLLNLHECENERQDSIKRTKLSMKMLQEQAFQEQSVESSMKSSIFSSSDETNEQFKSIASDSGLSCKKHFIKFRAFRRHQRHLIEKPKIRWKSNAEPMESHMLGGLLQQVQDSATEKRYQFITQRYQKSQHFHLGDASKIKLRQFDRVMEKTWPSVDRPFVQSASITYYLFRSSPKNCVGRRLYQRKLHSSLFKALWRNAFQAFQLIYMEQQIQKRQKIRSKNHSKRKRQDGDKSGEKPKRETLKDQTALVSPFTRRQTTQP